MSEFPRQLLNDESSQSEPVQRSYNSQFEDGIWIGIGIGLVFAAISVALFI